MADTMLDDAVTNDDHRLTTWGWLRSSWRRSSNEQVVSGVAAGVAALLQLPTAYVRAAFVSLAMAGGFGVAVYVAAWLLANGTRPTASTPRQLASHQTIGLGLMLFAVLLTLSSVGLWFGDAVVGPVTLVSFGVAAMWDRNGVTPGAGPANGGPGRLRVIGGAVLMLGGFALFLGRLGAMRDLASVILAVAVTAAGFMLVFGPWASRLANDLAKERSDRIRTEERAEVAAHLHDSVLQTLALIQRSDDPRRMVTLARSQERELRSWLYGREDRQSETLQVALSAAADRVEGSHDVPVEVVVVQDLPMDPKLEPIVAAATEAMHNAARHSGADRVSVYAEPAEGALDVFVSDQGSGFDPSEVPDDRHGLRHSIIGRMERHGGSATIHADPGEGTEVHLSIPFHVPANQPTEDL